MHPATTGALALAAAAAVVDLQGVAAVIVALTGAATLAFSVYRYLRDRRTVDARMVEEIARVLEERRRGEDDP